MPYILHYNDVLRASSGTCSSVDAAAAAPKGRAFDSQVGTLEQETYWGQNEGLIAEKKTRELVQILRSISLPLGVLTNNGASWDRANHNFYAV